MGRPLVKFICLTLTYLFVGISLVSAETLICHGKDGKEDARYIIEDGRFSLVFGDKTYPKEIIHRTEQSVTISNGQPFAGSEAGLGYLGEVAITVYGKVKLTKCGCMVEGLSSPKIAREIDRYTLESRLVSIEEKSGATTADIMFPFREHGDDETFERGQIEKAINACRDKFGLSCVVKKGMEIAGQYDRNSRSQCSMVAPKF